MITSNNLKRKHKKYKTHIKIRNKIQPIQTKNNKGLPTKNAL